ncbi:MAG: hydantoinase/oxoprolinase family protein [bacterium]|nr:hydantoinase/oxoprolinase family protein [Acidimicrobiia bacterium]MCY4649967.1 hydantoinase/oxoprolinase family protein [bacterium]
MSPSGQQPPQESRIGVDVGGTFTDVVVTSQSGDIYTYKLLSTPRDFSEGVVEGIGEIIRSHRIEPAETRDVVHGSTVATNAILERKGALTGLLTTAGFADVLELRRLRVPKLYDVTWQKPQPLVDRSRRLEVIERVGVDGEVVTALDLDDARQKVKRLMEMGVESIAVSLIHSYADPSHETAIGELLAKEYPHVWTSLSHRVLPVIREYERTSTTVLNAYVRPVVASYLEALRGKLDGLDVTAPLLIMQSNGGVMTSEAAAERPAYVVESGPAAGVIASSGLARSLGVDNAITFDMGGTTAKTALVEDGEPHFTAEFEVASAMSAGSRLRSGGGYALSVPFIDLAEVGAGGGSIVWIDSAGAPKVGPSSAGALPGPVCYGKGGDEPTVTDANLLLGYLNPEGLLDGAVKLDVGRARAVFDHKVAGPLGLDTQVAAYGAHLIANASMIRAIKSVSVQRGRDPRDFTMIAFGGSGPVHAVGIARELGIKRVIVPPQPGVFSAVGLLEARLEFHAKKTYLRRTASLSRRELQSEIGELEAQAREGVGHKKLHTVSFEFEPWVEMRYVGQGFELPVRLPPFADDWSSWVGELNRAFGEQHLNTYGHVTNNPTEIVQLLVVIRELNPPGVPASNRPDSQADGSRKREVFFGDAIGLLPTPVLRRGDLALTPADAPMIVEDYDATTVVPPGYRVFRDRSQNVIIEEGSA